MSTSNTNSLHQLVLITGASNGIGLELARVFAQNKYDLILVARSKDKLEKLASELKNEFQISAHIFELDLAQIGAAEKLHSLCKAANLQPNSLINNAGFGDVGDFFKMKPTVIEEMMTLNMTNLTLLCRFFGADMLARSKVSAGKNINMSSHIVNIASTAAFLPGPFMAVYYATKAYVLSFSEALAEELQKENCHISVTAICPGPTWSGFQERAQLDSSLMLKAPWIMSSK